MKGPRSESNRTICKPPRAQNFFRNPTILLVTAQRMFYSASLARCGTLASATRGLSFGVASGMSNQQIIDRHQSAMVLNYGKLPAVLVRGEGSRLWDADGKQYIDLFAGFGGTI